MVQQWFSNSGLLILWSIIQYLLIQSLRVTSFTYLGYKKKKRPTDQDLVKSTAESRTVQWNKSSRRRTTSEADIQGHSVFRLKGQKITRRRRYKTGELGILWGILKRNHQHRREGSSDEVTHPGWNRRTVPDTCFELNSGPPRAYRTAKSILYWRWRIPTERST